MAKSGLVWFKFYPRDWRTDDGLRTCTFAARGLCIELLCLMHHSARRGVLLTAVGEPMPVEMIARLTGGRLTEVKKLLAELQQAGVFSEEPSGAVYSRRMVRDEAERQAGMRNGKAGGNPTLKQPAATPLTPARTPGVNPPPNPQSTEARVQKKDPPNPPPGGGMDGAGAGEPGPKRQTRRKSSRPTDPPGFAEFWAAYPRRVDRLAAVRAFAAIDPDPDLLANILAGARRYAAHVVGKEPTHVKHPSGWLTGERWGDDLLDPAANAAYSPADIARRTDERLEALNQEAPPPTWQRRQVQTLFPSEEVRSDDA